LLLYTKTPLAVGNYSNAELHLKQQCNKTNKAKEKTSCQKQNKTCSSLLVVYHTKPETSSSTKLQNPERKNKNPHRNAHNQHHHHCHKTQI
jgi:hypothetical protein